MECGGGNYWKHSCWCCWYAVQWLAVLRKREPEGDVAAQPDTWLVPMTAVHAVERGRTHDADGSKTLDWAAAVFVGVRLPKQDKDAKDAKAVGDAIVAGAAVMVVSDSVHCRWRPLEVAVMAGRQRAVRGCFFSIAQMRPAYQSGL